ncbi:MAG: DUF6236 family protein [Segetibacter sp.]
MVFSDYVMYVSKLTVNIAQYLRNNHLLKDMQNDNEVALEKNTALIYRSMLANYLAHKSKVDILTPSTDQVKYENLAFQLADKKALTYRIQLDDCLPTPLPDAKIKDLAKFKKKRKLELLEFREVLDKAEQEISLVNDDQEGENDTVSK